MIYKTKGVCATSIEFDVEDDIITSLRFTGGCNGNLQGISQLVVGMKVNDVIAKLEGLHCGFKNTSCPDQLATALKQYQSEH